MRLPDPIRGGDVAGSCRGCGYSLVGLPGGGPCPECGRDENNPEVGAAFSECLACGYPLTGLDAYGTCPECGTRMPDPALTVRLFGTAKSQETKAWRRVVWVVLAVSGVVFSQFFLMLLLRGQGWLVVFWLFALAAGIVAMLLTGTSKTSGVECFSFTTAGLGRSTPKGDAAGRSFHPWRGQTVVHINRVGTVWSKLRVLELIDGKQRVVLDAGVRCPDEHRGWVNTAIREAIGAEREERAKREADDAAAMRMGE